MPDRELPGVACDGSAHLPVVLGHEGLDLLLAVDNQGQGRALDPSDGQEPLAQPGGGERDEPGERRAPHQVDVLPGLAGLGEVLVQQVRVGERLLDLLLGQRRELRATDVGVVVDLPYQVLHVRPDELAFAVVVSRYHHAVRHLREPLQRTGEHLLRGDLQELGVDQVSWVDLLPLPVLLGEIDLQYVAAETQAGDRVPVIAERIHGAARPSLLLGFPV